VPLGISGPPCSWGAVTWSSRLGESQILDSEGLLPENVCVGEGQQHLQTTIPASRQRGRPTSTNPQLSDSNKNLVLDTRRVVDVMIE
jgi:hypothetical protein